MRDNIKTIVFSAIWESYLPVKGEKNGISYYAHDPERNPVFVNDKNSNAVLNKFSMDIKHLTETGKKVFVILSNPSLTSYNPKYMVSRISGNVIKTTVQRKDAEAKVEAVTEAMKIAAETGGATLLNPIEAFCDEIYCPTMTQDGKPVYKDNHHLRPFYAVEKSDFLKETMY